jgi:hypothetical protein
MTNESVKEFLRTGRGGGNGLFRIVITLLFLAILPMAALTFQHLHAHPDIGGFDPVQMGRLESRMWRSYYEGRWVQLGWATIEVACGQYGFSWWDGTRLACHAARSAAAFRNKGDAPRCLPELVDYYLIVERSAPVHFDPVEAARLELEWWRERRRNLPPEIYSKTIAQLLSLLYGISPGEAASSARMRAEAMEYRDNRRDGRMSDSDWLELERRLTAAYGDLRGRLERDGGGLR